MFSVLPAVNPDLENAPSFGFRLLLLSPHEFDTLLFMLAVYGRQLFGAIRVKGRHLGDPALPRAYDSTGSRDPRGSVPGHRPVKIRLPTLAQIDRGAERIQPP